MGAAAQNAAAFHEANVLGSRFVAEQAAQAGVRRFIFLSTIKVNGEGGDGRAYRADDPPNPSDCYSKSKLAAEQTLRALCLVAGMEFVVIRSPLVYGPGVRANFARLLDLAALGLPLPLLSIDNRRSFVGVWNLADFIEICMTHPHANGKTWLISDGEDLSTPDLVRRLARLMHKPARLFSFSPRLLQRLSALFGMSEEVSRLCDSLCIDASPTFRQLNWQPRVSVDEGLARTVAAYQESHGP
jgi:UDP-glucose 4-epimerase